MQIHQPVLGFGVVNGVTAGDEDAGLGGLVVAALQYLDQYAMGKFNGKPDDVEGQYGSGAHGIDVAEGVGHGYCAELVRVVHYGGEEVHGLDEGNVLPQAIDGGVITCLRSHQQVGVGDLGQLAQDLRQVLRTEFGGSTGAMGQAGQPDTVLLQWSSLLSCMALLTGKPNGGTDIVARGPGWL